MSERARRLQRQAQTEAGAPAVARQAMHLPTMALGDLAHQRQPEAHATFAFGVPGHAEERLEDVESGRGKMVPAREVMAKLRAGRL